MNDFIPVVIAFGVLVFLYYFGPHIFALLSYGALSDGPYRPRKQPRAIKVINALVFRDKKVLLVWKKDVWILPGGKQSQDETDEDCLRRELEEELSTTKIKIWSRFEKHFTGLSPHTHSKIRAEVYIVTIQGDIAPRNEITLARFFSKADLHEIEVSEITKKILLRVIATDEHL